MSETTTTGADLDVRKDGERVSACRSGGKHLTFFLDDEEYALDILKVHEIIGMMPITPVPRTPDFVRGVLNLRGKVIPVIDLRAKFGMEVIDSTEETCIIVVQIEETQMGIVVDKVSEVLEIAETDIDATSAFGGNVNTDYILGIGKTGGQVKLVLDIDKVLASSELAELQTAMNQVED